MHIRNATAADIPLIRELTMQVWPHTYTPILGQEQVAYMLDRFYNPTALQQQMEDQGHQFIIGYDGERPTAFASYSLLQPAEYKLQKLYVIAGGHGMGAGRYMVSHIINELRQTGAATLRLNVNIYNTGAIAFYFRLGFSKIAAEDIDIGNGYFMNDFVLSVEVGG